MNHSEPRLPSDYPCHCPHCEPPDPERDWLQEALAIYHGSTRLLAQREHIVALVNRMMDQRSRMIYDASAQAAGVAEQPSLEDLRDLAEREESIQGGLESDWQRSLTDKVDREDRESFDAADRAAQEQVAHE